LGLIRAYLDTNIFLIYLEVARSNSKLVVNIAEEGLFSPVVSFHTFKEVAHNLKSRKSKDLASWMRMFIWSIQDLTVVQKDEIDQISENITVLVTDKDDLPHVCSYFVGNCDYFVTTNRRLTQQKIGEKVNFVSPKKFVEILGLKSIETPNEI
jgi:predicted nucleic acid-binding protein